MALVLRKLCTRLTPLLKCHGFHKTSSPDPLLCLPTEARKRVTVLQCESGRAPSGICNVYLVGVCHASPRSSRDVKAIVSLLKPDIVFLELCNARVHAMYADPVEKITPSFNGFMNGLLEKKSNLFQLIESLMYRKIYEELPIIPGSEFRVAYEEAMKYGGHVILGDRPIQITAQRAEAGTNLLQKIRLIFEFLILYRVPSETFKYLLSESIEQFEDEFLNRKDTEVKNNIPRLEKVIVDERNEYMCATLLKVASESKSVVAVVGMAHVTGMARIWKKAIGLEMD